MKDESATTAKVPTPSAHDRALRLLGSRAHFRAELRRKLREKGHEEGEVLAALDALEATGALDDRRLALEEADRLRSRKSLGRRAVAAELRRKGAPDEAVAAALEASDPNEDPARALEAAHRWLRTRRFDAGALGRHLERKGYDRRAILRVLKELASDLDSAPSDD